MIEERKKLARIDTAIDYYQSLKLDGIWWYYSTEREAKEAVRRNDGGAPLCRAITAAMNKLRPALFAMIADELDEQRKLASAAATDAAEAFIASESDA